MPRPYKVRERFVVVKGLHAHRGGEVVELSEKEAQDHAHKIEAVGAKQSDTRKGGR